MNKIEELLVEFEKNWSWMYQKHIAVDELVKEVKVLITSAVEEERERCAEIAESLVNNYYPVGSKGVHQYPTKICNLIAKAIREQ